MNTITEYPGEGADAAKILDLAKEYHVAAKTALEQSRKGAPHSRAPCRLIAIHAIELYLNGYLLSTGKQASEIRSMQHNLVLRTECAVEKGLVLKKRTVQHLERLTDFREYTVTRYGPEMATSLSQINRLMATVDEVAKKTVPQPVGS